MDLSTREGRREQGRLIQDAIERAGLSAEELARRVGCSRALVYQYLAGTTLAQPDRLQRIAAEVGVPLDFFFGGATQGAHSTATGEISPSAGTLGALSQLARYQAAPPDWAACASTCERILGLASQAGDGRAEADALLRLAEARLRLGDALHASEALERAVAVAHFLGDIEMECDARLALARTLLEAGKTEGLKRVLERFPESAPELARGWAALWRGAAAEHAASFAEALREADAADAVLSADPEIGQRDRGRLGAGIVRATSHNGCGDLARAREHAEWCVSHAETARAADHYADASLIVADVCLSTGDWDEAFRVATATLRLARFVGDRPRAAAARACVALVLAALCDCDECIKQAKDALADALSVGCRRAQMAAQMALAEVYLVTGRRRESGYHSQQALDIAQALHAPLHEASARLRLCRVAYAERDLRTAHELASHVLGMAMGMGARHLEAEARLVQSSLLAESGSHMEAAEEGEHTLGMAREMGAAPIAWRAHGLLGRLASATSVPSDAEALRHTGKAVELVETVRQAARRAGIREAMLEDSERLDIYVLHADLLARSVGMQEVLAFTDMIGWQPLRERIRLADGG